MVSKDALDATDVVQALVGQSFVQLCVGVGEAQLRFTGESAIVVESAVEVGEAGPAAPSTLEGLALLLPLLSGDVSAAAVSDPGELSLVISGTTVRCAGDTRFEAWNYTGPAGELVVSRPGVGLAIFGPR